MNHLMQAAIDILAIAYALAVGGLGVLLLLEAVFGLGRQR